MKRFVIGDIHGGYKAMLQCFKRSEIDPKQDTLFCLGDVADGWSQTPECFEELLKFKNLIYIIGNHDIWLLDWFRKGLRPPIWTSQGGQATLDAYVTILKTNGTDMLHKHEYLLKEKSHYYYVTDDNKLFVHAGFNWHIDIRDEAPHDLYWDRDLFFAARQWENYMQNGKSKDKPKHNIVKDYNEVFIGHTTTSQTDPELKPVHASNIWNLDQGAGWEGKLTIMNVDTKRYWQSDIVKTLYPDERGR